MRISTKFGIAFAAALLPVVTTSTKAQSMDTNSITVERGASRASQPGPAEWFTGRVRIDPLFSAKEVTQAAASNVTFEPGSRTAWHTHPRGQTLVVLSGAGRVQKWGEPAQQILPGDVVWIPAGVKHWHGAQPNVAMTHMAIQEHLNNVVVEWLEHVTDKEYVDATPHVKP